MQGTLGQPKDRPQVAITRTPPGAQRLADCLGHVGLHGIHTPALHIVPSSAWQQVQPRAEPDLVVVVSQHAAERYQASPCYRAAVPHVAVGTATARVLRAHLAPPASVYTPAEATAEGLFALPQVQALQAGQRVWLISGEGGRAWLGEALSTRQLEVVKLPFYRRQATPPDKLRARQVDIIEISSMMALQSIMATLQDDVDTLQWAHATVVVVPSRRLREAVAAAGFAAISQADSAVAEDMARACAGVVEQLRARPEQD